MIIGMPVYDKVDLLGVTGPHEMLGRLNASDVDVEVRVIAADRLQLLVVADGRETRPHAPAGASISARARAAW